MSELAESGVTVGRIVLYQTDQRGGLRYALPAIVVCTRYSHPEAGGAESPLPRPSAPDHVHLRVFSPGEDYVELNVPWAESGSPARSWRWPRDLPAEHVDARGKG